jgi:hypothetical protein
MGFFKKIFRRKSSKRNKDDGFFLEGIGSEANIVKKSKSKKKVPSYNSFKSPELAKRDPRRNDSNSKNVDGIIKRTTPSNDSSYGSSFDSGGGLPPGISSRLRSPVGHLKQNNNFRANFSDFNDENNFNRANQSMSPSLSSPYQASGNVRRPQDARRSPMNRHSPHGDQVRSPYGGNSNNPQLSYNQIQHLEQQNSPKPVDSRYFKGQADSKKLELTRFSSGDLVDKNLNGGIASPSSDFDLSTDAEDNEYNRIRDANNDFHLKPMLQTRISEEEYDDFSPHGSTDLLHKKNSMYLSQDESEFGNSISNGSGHRSKNYFSDSDNDMFSPTSQTSRGSNHKSPQNMSSLSLSQSETSKGIETRTFSKFEQDRGQSKFVKAASPRSLAIQEAQNNRAYPDSSDSDFDGEKKNMVSPRSTQRVLDKIEAKTGVIENFVEFQNNAFDKIVDGPSSKSVNDATSSVAELLAQAKARRGMKTAASVSSTPNLPRPVNDPLSTRSKTFQRRQEKKSWVDSHKEHSDEESKTGETESWLFNEVSGALGPQGIQADLESLGERSHRSRHSHRSNRSGSRRIKGSEASVSSRHSRSSRASRYSIKSTKSHLSQMSVESRSVANDLIRLEMQLAMVGSKAGDNVVKKELEMEAKKKAAHGVPAGIVNGSNSGPTTQASLGIASSSQMGANRTVSTITKRVKKTVEAPPGKLGIILANKTDSRGTVVSGVRTNSVLFDKIIPGDRIVAIDGEDVSRMSVSEITTIMSRKSDFDRTLTVLTNPKQQHDTILGAY